MKTITTLCLTALLAGGLLTGCGPRAGMATADAKAALPLIGTPLRFDYGDFKADVLFTQDSVTWSDGKNTETDALKQFSEGGGVHFVRWREKDGTDVTLYINLNTMVVHNSVVPPGGGEAWFMRGVIQRR